jgi:hypothetical protein
MPTVKIGSKENPTPRPCPPRKAELSFPIPTFNRVKISEQGARSIIIQFLKSQGAENAKIRVSMRNDPPSFGIHFFAIAINHRQH